MRRSATRLLVRTGRQGGLWVFVLAVNVLVLSAAEAVLPAVLGRTIDGVVGRGAAEHWLLWSALVIAVLVLCDVTDELGEAASTARSTAWLRRTTVHHLLSVKLRSLDRLSPGELVTRVVGNTADSGGVAPDIISGVTSLLLAVAGVIALALIDPWLCLTFLAGMPLLTLMLWAFARDASEQIERYLETQGVIASRLLQALQGARTISAAGTTERETRRVLEPLEDLHRHGKGMWRAVTRITAQDTLLLSLLEIAVLAVAGVELARGRISPGELFAASQYVVLASSSSGAVSSLLGLIRERAAVTRVDDILRLPVAVYGERTLEPGPGRLDVRGVTVRVGGRVVLDDISLAVPGGSLVAVVGRSGAGKSQFAWLVGRLVEPDEGVVLLDGMSLAEIDRRSLRRSIGYGFERPSLIGETFSDAIAFGTDEPSDHRVTEAARDAHAEAFIRRMPSGFQTRLEDAPMSGGEVQRVGLARTFAHAQRVLVLDDVAASLDTVTEHEISRALTGAMSDLTRILVAHRVSTAARADTVLWLENGRVRGLAPHHALWSEPSYRAVFEADAGHAPALPVGTGVSETP